MSERLTEQEYKAWWPFERLDPKRFPKQLKQPKKGGIIDDYEEAPF